MDRLAFLTLAPELAVEQIDGSVIGGLSRPGDVERHAIHVGPDHIPILRPIQV